MSETTSEESGLVVTVNLPLKANINRINVLKHLGDHRQELIGQLTIKSEDCKLVEAPLFNGFTFNMLRSLRIESPLVTIPDRMFAELPDLISLSLSRNQIENVSPNVLKTFSNLQMLDLSGNNISSLKPELFKQLQTLRSVNLSHNGLGSMAPGAFIDLINLESLDLSFNKFVDVEPRTFEFMFRLKELNLSGNQIKQITPSTFQFTKGIQGQFLYTNLNSQKDLLLRN